MTGETRNVSGDILSGIAAPLCNRAYFTADDVVEISGLSNSEVEAALSGGDLISVAVLGANKISRVDLISWLDCLPFRIPEQSAVSREHATD